MESSASALAIVLSAVGGSALRFDAGTRVGCHAPRTTAACGPAMMAKSKVFIDGEAGTTGLQVRDRLAKREDLEVLSLPEGARKDAAARAEAINAADAVILCLPDAAAIEAANLVDPSNKRTVLIDASTAHRVNPDWVYGFPELSADQRAAITTSKRIANPGCYATGFIALIAPLVAAALVRPSSRLVVSAISGYSGGGKNLIEAFESGAAHEPWGAYAFALNHKHLPEMSTLDLHLALSLTLTLTLTPEWQALAGDDALAGVEHALVFKVGLYIEPLTLTLALALTGKFAGIEHDPIFLPAVGAFAQGMVVSVPIRYDTDLEEAALSGGEGVGKGLHAALSKHYAGCEFVSVMPLGEAEWKEAGLLERGTFLRPDSLNNTNELQVFVYCNEEKRTAVLAARLDNLGKGASGAAVQNLNLALGLDEKTGL